MVVLHFFISFPIPFVGLEGELFTYRRGGIALNGWANCNSPLHVCFLDVRKYTCKYV